MSPRSLADRLGMSNLDLVTIFYDEAKRITLDEKEALSLTRDAVKDFLHHSVKVSEISKPDFRRASKTPEDIPSIV